MDKGRVLVVDDQEEILASLEGILADEGHEVIRARDGQEALHIVQSDSPDVVFLDIWIPGIDGMQTLKAIKRIAPDCSVIMMSGHGTIETAVKAIKLGATDYLEKPLNLEDVLHLLEKAISERSAPGSPNIVNGGSSGEFIGVSDKAERLRRAMKEAAADSGSIWLVGDEGTGKEFCARIIHHLEGKVRNGLVKVRCSELTENNFREVFHGNVAGSGRRPGRIGQAVGGTLVFLRLDRLDESVRHHFAELTEHLFPGGSGSDAVPGFSGRVVSTSIYDPDALVRDHGFPRRFAEIMSHRVIRIPELRERAEDIPLYVEHFLREAVDEFDTNIAGIDDEAMARLVEYPWPGNVKELKILIEHVVMTAPGPGITLKDLLIPGNLDVTDPKIDAAASERETARAPAERIPDAHEEPGGSPASPRNSRVRHQKTLRGKVVMYGQGLHSGVKTGLTLSPLPPGSGILFGHITSGGAVPAVLRNVESTELATCLRANGSSVRTIEHLLAVFHVYGLTNVLVKISGEVPIMDGSALEFCNLVESAEIIGQEEAIEEARVTRPLELPFPGDSGKSMRVEPSDYFEVEYSLDYPPPVGSMHMAYRCLDPEDFKRNIAPARTFGFVKDMRMLDEMGLAGGGRLSNVVLLDDEKVVNPPLRFPDEFVRHKILDIVGDFYLFGRPFKGKVIARQTGHTENISMLRLIDEELKIFED